MSDVPEPKKLTEEQAVDFSAAIQRGDAIVCYEKCWPCQAGQCFDPPAWHTWADEDDIEHAKSTGQPNPNQSRCGCSCAVTADG